jgi:hypothetical protein
METLLLFIIAWGMWAIHTHVSNIDKTIHKLIEEEEEIRR